MMEKETENIQARRLTNLTRISANYELTKEITLYTRTTVTATL